MSETTDPAPPRDGRGVQAVPPTILPADFLRVERALAQAIGEEHLAELAESSPGERAAGADFIDVWSGLIDLEDDEAWDWWLGFLDRHAGSDQT